MIKRIRETKTTTHTEYDYAGSVKGKTVVVEEIDREEEEMLDDDVECQCELCEDTACDNPEDCWCQGCRADGECADKCSAGDANAGGIPEGVDFIGCKCNCDSKPVQEDGPKMSLATYLSTLANKEQELKPKQVKFITIPANVTPEELIQLLSTLSGK